MKKIFPLVCLLALLSGCSTFQKTEPVPLAQRVDLEKFIGEWYVIASMPTLIDRKAYNATKTYSRAERGINIHYHFTVDAFDGPERNYNTRAMVDNPGINTDWETGVFPWPFERDYKILHIEPDYSVAVVGHPNRKYLWILSRSKTIEDPVYSDIILYLQNLGWDVGKIRRIPQR